MLTNYFKQQPKCETKLPQFDDFVSSYRFLLNEFPHSLPSDRKRGRPFTYNHAQLVIFFTIMVCHKIVDFKAQNRWLCTHQEKAKILGFQTIPDRTTLSKRWKQEYVFIKTFIEFIGEKASEINTLFSTEVLYEDSSVFRSMGNLWHAPDRLRDPVNPPKGVRCIDKDANWTKSKYHGFVFGYKIHLTVNANSFPINLLVESANYSDSKAIDTKENWLIKLHPKAIVTDNGYFQATRVKRWQQNGIMFLTPASSWTTTKPAIEYHAQIKKHHNAKLLYFRKIVVEPVFDLLPKIMGVRNNHKQLPMRSLGNVRTFGALSVLALQVVMLENYKRNIPMRTVSYLLDAFR